MHRDCAFYSRQLLLSYCLDWVRDPREQKTSRPDLSIVKGRLCQNRGCVVKKNFASYQNTSKSVGFKFKTQRAAYHY
jgi:hypothetical protein